MRDPGSAARRRALPAEPVGDGRRRASRTTSRTPRRSRSRTATSSEPAAPRSPRSTGPASCATPGASRRAPTTTPWRARQRNGRGARDEDAPQTRRTVERLCIKPGYRENAAPRSFDRELGARYWTEERLAAASSYQYPVYRAVPRSAALARRAQLPRRRLRARHEAGRADRAAVLGSRAGRSAVVAARSPRRELPSARFRRRRSRRSRSRSRTQLRSDRLRRRARAPQASGRLPALHPRAPGGRRPRRALDSRARPSARVATACRAHTRITCANGTRPSSGASSSAAGWWWSVSCCCRRGGCLRSSAPRAGCSAASCCAVAGLPARP